MEFQTVQIEEQNDTKAIVLNFLESVDGSALSREVLDNMGWGDGGDPVESAIQILIKRVSEW